jgi:hypothetical protein
MAGLNGAPVQSDADCAEMADNGAHTTQPLTPDQIASLARRLDHSDNPLHGQYVRDEITRGNPRLRGWIPNLDNNRD